jgi:outer membrane protein TolC
MSIRPAALAVAAGLLAATAPAAADPLNLQEAITLAVRRNPALGAAGADVGIAQAAALVARGLDDPVLDAAGTWRESRSELVAGAPVQQPAADQITGTLGLTQPLPTGGRLGLRLLDDYSLTRFATGLDSMMPLTRSTSDAFAPSLQLSLVHPLLRGFGVPVARADRRRARAQIDAATAGREGVAAALVRDVVLAYWDLAFAARELDIRRAAAASAREQLRRVEANIGVGKQPRSASAEIEVAIALRDDAVLSAEQILMDRAIELGRLCGLPITVGRGPMVVAAETPPPSATVPDGGAALARALAQSPQLAAARAQGRAAAIEIDVTDNGLLPQLDVGVAGGPVANAATAHAAYSQITGFSSYTVRADLIFQQAIGRHQAHGALAAARERLRKVQLTESDIAAQVAAAVGHAVAAIEAAHRRADVLAPSTRAAALDLEAEKARFEVGRSTNFDVLRRQDSLAEVQLVLLRAQVDHLKALAALEAATGDILTHHGVVLR